MKDPASGREICTRERPYTKDAPGPWMHPEAKITGECYEGCCDEYTCPVCNHTWMKECPQ